MARRSILVLWMIAILVFPAASRAEKPEKKDPPKKETEKKEPEKKEPEKKEPTVKSVAHIRLAGALDETPPPADPLFSGIHENFKSKLDRIKKAQKDENVQALLLDLDGLLIGWGKLDELSRAIADFRKAGKKAYAFLDSGSGLSSKDYLLALACDEVAMPDPGWLMLTGVRAEVTFYKDLLDKLGVKADMLRMGDAKSAAEPYTRTSLSEASRKQLTGVLDDYFENGLVGRIVAARRGKGLDADKVKKIVDEAPYTARAAQKLGLLDQVLYADAFEARIKAALKADEVKILRNYAQAKMDDIDFSNPFAIFKLLAPPKSASSLRPKVAVIYATGVITAGRSGEGLMGDSVCGAKTMIEAIRKAENDKTVKAIVLRVDSPGGSATGSDLIWNELRQCKKPVIASMSDVAASGGYYISMAARKIYAEPGTLTGSIGVFGGKLAFGGLYEKLGLKTEVIQRGANAGIFSTTSPFTPSEKSAMTALMKDIYEQFLDKAVLGRKAAGKSMARAQLEPLAGGRIWTGRQALGHGLVDELGTLQDAVAAAWREAGMSVEREPELLILPKAKSFLDTLMEGKSDSLSPDAQLRLLKVLPDLAQPLNAAGSLLNLRGEPIWLMVPYRVDVR
jgi:protease-4